MSSIEAFLLIEQPRQRLGHWTAALASLDSPLAPEPTAVVAYYDPSCDQALLNLQYDLAAVGDRGLDFLVQVALLAEVGMVQPAELSEGERVRFLASRLTRCTIRVTAQRSAVGALCELVRKIKDERAPQTAMKPLAPPPIPTAAKRPKVPMPAPRGPVVAEPVQTAKGTRDNLERLITDEPVPWGNTAARGTRDDVLRLPATDMDAIPELEPDTSPPSTRMETVDISRRSDDTLIPSSLTRPPANTSRHVVVRSARLSTVQMPPEVAHGLASRHVSTDDDDDNRTTSPMDLEKLQALAATEDAHRMPPPLRPPTENDFAEEDDVRPSTMPALRKTARALAPLTRRPQSEPYVTTSQQPNVIYVRYLRGGRWVAARVGALSLKGAALLAGALPRIDDRVDIGLTFGSHRALVRGIVAKVSNRGEAAATGASTFSVTFQLDAISRRQLTELLVAARDAKITIKPPPPRATRRFPVEWHIGLATPKGAIKAVALDVSTGGLFVRTPITLELDTIAGFSIMLDDGGSPVVGRVKVVRKITEVEARTCGLAAGFGLLVTDMSEADRMRWLGFLARIERRAEKRVLIGADPARLAELQASLASLGYAVSGGTDPGTLVQLASADARPADAVLIDAGWLQNESSTSLVESLFSARNVPCVTLQGEVRRARQAIDRLLEVVV